MANAGIPYEVVAGWYEPQALRWTSHYLKKLLIERHYIRSELENPGGSIITGSVARAADADQLPSYSSRVGNPAHLDLLEAEAVVNKFDARDRIELLAWCDGLSAKQAAEWANLRGGPIRSTQHKAAAKRLERRLDKAATEHNNEAE